MKSFTKIAAILSILCITAYLPAQSQQSNFDSVIDRLQKRQPSVVSNIRNKFSQNGSQLSPSTIPEKRTCGTVEFEEILHEKYPQRPSRAEFEAIFRRKVEAYKRGDLNREITEVITIPFIVHVVHNGENIGVGTNISASQIQSQIDVMNEDFRRVGQGANTHPDGADMEIEFAPALFDPDGNRLDEPGIRRINGERAGWDYNAIERTLKPQTQWDPELYLNMWTVNFGGDDADLLGYAQFPSLSNLPGLNQNEGLARTDGVVMRYNAFGRTGNVVAPYDGGRTTTHEIGHWLGLRHIWGDGDCSEDDFCNDTPPASQPNYDCVETSSCPDNGRDMVENYMDYSPDDCMNVFTNDQKARIRTVMENSPRRRELLNSTVHIDNGTPVGAPVAAFSVDKQNACVDDVVSFQDQSSNNPTSWEWKFYDVLGNELATFTEQNLQVTFGGIGSYSVELTVSNSTGSTSKLEESYITVISNELANGLTEDFEDTLNLINNWVLFNPDGDRTFTLANASAFEEGNYSAVIDNYSLQDDPTGKVDALISPRLDFTGISNPYMSFDHAYAQFDDEYSDTLVLIYSLDCGNTLEGFGVVGGADLATAPSTEEFFVPTADQWQENQISLAFLANQPSVHIFIVNLSGWGNNLYLDNISFLDGNDVVQAPPEADFFTGTTRICEGDMIQFQDQSSNFPSQWFWGFAGGNPEVATIQNPLIQYDSAGIYGVQLTVFNTFGVDAVERNEYIEVVPLPDVRIDVSQETICAGDSVRLIATGAETYAWFDERSGGQPIYEGDTLVLKLFESRTYTVVGYNDLGCESEIEQTIIVASPPEVEVTSNQEAICAGEDIQLTATGASEYVWYLGDDNTNAIFEGEVLTLMLAEGQSFTVVGINEFGCEDMASLDIEVNPNPEIFITTSQTEICAEDTVQLTASGADQYLWYEGNNINPIFEGEVFVSTLAESQNFTVVGVDEAGCENESNLTINVTPRPELSIDVSSETVCEGSLVQLTASGAEEYLWFDEDNGFQPIFNGAVLEWPATSSQNIRLIGLNDNCEAFASQAISVAPNPEVPDIAIEGDTLTALIPDNSTYQYQWYLDENSIPSDQGGQDTSYVITQSGNYRLEIITDAGCIASSPSYDVILTAIDRIDLSDQISIYPNPTQDQVHIQLPESFMGNWKLKVHNAIGQEISAFSQELKQRETTLDLSQLPKGAYFFYLMNEEAQAFKKVVKR